MYLCVCLKCGYVQLEKLRATMQRSAEELAGKGVRDDTAGQTDIQRVCISFYQHTFSHCFHGPVRLSNASVYRPLSASKTWKLQTSLEHDTAFAVRWFPVRAALSIWWAVRTSPCRGPNPSVDRRVRWMRRAPGWQGAPDGQQAKNSCYKMFILQ